MSNKKPYKIKLEKINDDNVWNITKLSVNEKQKEFVATNTQSIIQAYTAITSNRIALPFGIYADDQLVGFVMFGYGREDEEDPKVAENNYCIWRFMIDKEEQHKGYGKAALLVCMDYLRTMPCGKGEKCWLDCEAENIIAKTMYESIGVKENGELCDGALVMEVNL